MSYVVKRNAEVTGIAAITVMVACGLLISWPWQPAARAGGGGDGGRPTPTLECAAITSGGAIFEDGSIAVAGQPTIGLMTGPDLTLASGLVPCLWPFGAGPGDLNCDGLVNAFDIDPFILALTDPAGYQTAFPNCNILNADCNGDGAMNAFDIDPFIACLTTGCP